MPSGSDRGPSIVAPESVAEAAACLASARAEGRRVSIGRAADPPACDLVLSTRRLARLLEHEAGDLTCVVEPGVRLSALEAALAARGQRLAIDPPGDPTVGGCLAADLSGPLRHRFGTMRDLVLGVTVVLADGTVASAGGKVVKNVAGYDLAKLFCGSRGRLGLVVRLALRLHPLAAASASVAVELGEPADADAHAASLLCSTLVPSALDCVRSRGRARLGLLLEGTGRTVTAQVAAAAKLVGAEECSPELWQESREIQGRCSAVRTFDPWRPARALAVDGEAVARVAAGVAHVAGGVGAGTAPSNPGAAALAERVRAAFDPEGVLAC